MMIPPSVRRVRLTPEQEGHSGDTPPPSVAIARAQAREQRQIPQVYSVWHDRAPTFGRQPVEVSARRWLGRARLGQSYVKVAEVEAKDLDEVFALTQHLDSDWTTGPRVRWLNEFVKIRSSSIGDVISLGEPPEDNFWVIDWHGFYHRPD